MDFDLCKIESKVMKILIDEPETRDSYYLLLASFWLKELAGNIERLFDALKNGDITTPESITRASRKIQEVHVNLRGIHWEARHGMEAVVCNQLTMFDRW